MPSLLSERFLIFSLMIHQPYIVEIPSARLYRNEKLGGSERSEERMNRFNTLKIKMLMVFDLLCDISSAVNRDLRDIGLLHLQAAA